ncbi:MAG: hypothetical protein NZM44_04405 [Candidatus Calescibacterium sp.]|nr:hypothetical protein [Candidatus Calescibacterium sp.]
MKANIRLQFEYPLHGVGGEAVACLRIAEKASSAISIFETKIKKLIPLISIDEVREFTIQKRYNYDDIELEITLESLPKGMDLRIIGRTTDEKGKINLSTITRNNDTQNVFNEIRNLLLQLQEKINSILSLVPSDSDSEDLETNIEL